MKPPESDESLSETFWSVAHALRHQSRLTLTPWDLTPSQSRALAVLLRHGAMRVSDLAHHLHIAPRSATEFVDGLSGLGLVERRADPGDRRVTLVALTEAGSTTGEAIKVARRAETERIFGTLSEDDRDALARILRELRAAIEG